MLDYRIAVDTGGTFTDVVATGPSGKTWTAKSPTTPHDVFQGIKGAVELIADQIGIELSQLLASTVVITYATTHATNAIVTGKTAPTAFFVTAGHPDVLVLREGGRFGPFDYTQQYPDPYIPRSLTFEIEERLLFDGSVRSRLNHESAQDAIVRAKAKGIEAAAVCFLWSHVNPVHELEFAELLKALDPSLPVSLSHQVAPIIREYRRASATSIDASLKPLMEQHFESIQRNLSAYRFQGTLLVVTSSGGVVPVENAVSKPLLVVNSGPSIAPVGARQAAEADGIEGDLVIGDMGGTTFDISLVHEGLAKFARETWIDGQFTGHITGLPSVAVESIGYGGGSIARVDAGGMLRVGPNSVGADPGPACYGRGGSEATITDAAVALGLIDPGAFLGGRFSLNRDAAVSAVKRNVADSLGLRPEDAAAAVFEIAVEAMSERTREYMSRDGYAPSEAIFVAGGGASGLFAGEIGIRLGSRGVLVPGMAPVLSASGGLVSDTVMEFSASLATDSSDFDFVGVREVLGRLQDQMDGFLDELQTPTGERRYEFIAEGRYRHQVWELDVPMRRGEVPTASELEHLMNAFHNAHERVYGVRDPNQVVEFLYWRGRARAVNKAVSDTQAASSPSGSSSAVRRASVYVAGTGWTELDRVDGSQVAAGTEIFGPTLLDLPQTTIVVPANAYLAVSPNGNYMIKGK